MFGGTRDAASAATHAATFGASNAATHGASNAATHGASNAATHGASNAATHGATNADAYGAAHADAYGATNAATYGTAHADAFGTTHADAYGSAHAGSRAATSAGFALDLDVLTAAEMGRHGGAAADELVRIERIERDVAATAELAVDYLDNLAEELAARAARAVGLKTVIGARCGLDFDPARPSRGAVIAAANRRLSDPKEVLTDHVLLRYLLWSAIDVARERGLPMQFHTGFGGQTGEPHRADPARLSAFAAALQPLGVPVILLHCYPFHRQAAHLAGVFPHVYVDVGLAPPHGTAAAARVMDEMLELAPFHKQLFSSGCRGLAETGYLGALTYRRALAAALETRIEAGEWSTSDAARVAHMIGSGNARRVYRL
ncbi:amidohydrolase family protein [Nonomuraea sp. PA05]|nr:amidohydrolase family protein [Nonomuraea sp. PA05]